YGTGARASSTLKRNDIAGKTGTTNDSHDAWFAGYTPDLVGIAWMGFDRPRSLGSGETGGGAALPIWINAMREPLSAFSQKSLGDLPKGLSRINGDFYYDEFPPGKAIERVGLPSAFDDLGQEEAPDDAINELLRTLPQGNNAPQTAEPSFINP